jgi:hypothetical protein
MAEAEAETVHAGNLDAKRKFEQKMKMSDNMQQMIKNNKIVLSGETGDSLLNFFKETTDLVNLNVNE